MNPPEPNSADHSTDLSAIATDSDIAPQPSQNLGTFLDRLYGTLFLPQATFEQLNFIVVSLLQGKYQENVVKTDEEFINSLIGAQVIGAQVIGAQVIGAQVIGAQEG